MDERERLRAEQIGRLAQQVNLTVATADTPGGVFYFLVDSNGIAVYRFRPDSIVFSADDMTVEETLDKLFASYQA